MENNRRWSQRWKVALPGGPCQTQKGFKFYTTSDGKTLGDLKEERDDMVRFIILRNYPYLLHENCIVW